MSCLDNLKMPVRQSPITGGWCKSVARGLFLFALATFVAGVIGTDKAHAQHPPIVQVGGFNVQFWNMGDNGASGAFTPGGGVIPDANLGTWTMDQQQAIVRAMQYWTDRLGLPPAGPNAPVIRLVLDVATPNFNAFAASQGTVNNGGRTNTYNRLVDGANPQRTDTVMGTETGIDAALVFIPAQQGFDTAVMTQVPDLNSLEGIAIHEVGHLLGVANNVNVFDMDQNFLGVIENSAWAAQVDNAQTPQSLFNGTEVTALWGGPLPVQNPDTHFLLDFANLTRATPFNKDFRNQPNMSPLELAAFVDLGYTIDLNDHYGAALYQAGNGIQTSIPVFMDAVQGQDFGTGLYVQSDNHNLLVDHDIDVTGFAATGIRLNGGQEIPPPISPVNMMIGNTITIDPTTEVNANSAFGIGFWASAGANHVLVQRGDINATGMNGRGVVIDFSFGLLNFPGLQVASTDYGAPLVRRFDLTGDINTAFGLGTAIEIGPTAAVEEINVMNGAAINGNIISNALSTANLALPTITFGRTPDANGVATDAPDATFFLNYTHNISGTGPMTADLIGGETRFNGNVSFLEVFIRPTARLAGGGEITSALTVQQMGTIAPGNDDIDTLFIHGNLNSLGGTYDIDIQPGGPIPVPGLDNDLIIVDGFANLEGGTINVNAAPGMYNVGERYIFILTGEGVSTGTRLVVNDNIPNFRAVQSATPGDYGIVIARDGITASFARTFNQIAMATYLDTLKDAPNADFQNIRDILDSEPDTEKVLGYLDQMVGDIHGTMALVGLQNSSQMYTLLSRQMQGACCGCDGAWDGWILGYGRGGDVDYDGNAAGIDYSLGGTIFGAARCLGGPRVGFFGNYISPSVTSDVPMVQAETNSYTLGSFFEGYDYFGHFLAAAAVGYDEYTVNRRIQIASVDRMARSTYDGVQTSLYIEHDADISYFMPNVRPVASMQYLNVYQSSFVEIGAGSLNLAGSSNNTGSLRSFLGAQFRGDSMVGMGWACSPQLQLGWQHEFINPSSLYNARFAALGGPVEYTARGLDFGRNWGLIGLGLEMVNGNHWSVFCGYDAYANGRQTIHTGSGSLSFAW